MMVGTLITEENADSFMPAMGDYALINSDVFTMTVLGFEDLIGKTDSDTALKIFNGLKK